VPLEIREIGIRMQVGEADPPPRAALMRPERDDQSRRAIIEECVRRVLATLKTRQER
jgi:hypothetical protein